MTLTEMTSIIHGRLGSRSGLKTQIHNEIRMAQVKLELEEFQPWFSEVDENITFTATDKFYSLPATFNRPIIDVPLLYVFDESSNLIPLDPGDYAELEGKEDYFESNRPSRYASLGLTVVVFPTPDVNYNGQWKFHAKDSVLVETSNETNAWSTYCPDLLIAEAGYQMANTLRDPAAITIFSKERPEARERLHKSHSARRIAGFTMVVRD